MPLPLTTIVGNLTADPELRVLPGGQSVASFSVACSERRRNEDGSWVDGDIAFVRVNLWRDQAQNFARSAKKGMRVIAYGSLKQSKYTDREGVKRDGWQLDAADAGPSCRFAAFERAGDAPGDGWNDVGSEGGAATRGRRAA